jgi:hypothetical protein
MKLGKILQEIEKLRNELLESRPIIIRLDDESQSYDDWLNEQGVRDEEVIVVNIWIPYT